MNLPVMENFLTIKNCISGLRRQKITALLLLILIFFTGCSANENLPPETTINNTTAQETTERETTVKYEEPQKTTTLETTTNKELPKSTTEYMVLIGEDPSIVDKLSDIDVLVIDASYFTKEDIELLKSNNVNKIYSYLNIGSIESFRDYYSDYVKYTLGDYENWPDEKWMDVSQPKWQEFLLKKSNELLEKGIDGLFIDNVDVYYQFPTKKIYNGLVDILSDIKALNKTVIINGGDSFIEKYLKSKNKRVIFDGVNQESVYTTYDFSNQICLKNDNESIQYYTDYFDMLKKNNCLVYVIEYSTDSELTKKAYSFSKEHNYICYVSNNIELKMNK